MRALVLMLVASTAACAAASSATDESSEAASTTACAQNERVVNGACTLVPFANVSLGTITQRTNGVVSQANVQDQVYTYHYTPASNAAPTLTVGSCRVWSASLGGVAAAPGYEVVSADLGTVTVSGGPGGADVFTRVTDPNRPGYFSSHDNATLPFAGGEVMRVDTTGGADFPAVHMQLTAPMPLVLDEPGAFTPGADYRVSWNGGGGGDMILVLMTITTTESAYAFCTASDTGSFTFPAAVTTKLFPAAATQVSYVEAIRTVTRREEPAAKNVIVQWQAAVTDERNLTAQ